MSTIPKEINIKAETRTDSFVSFEEYMQLYYNAEDGFKYEWNNGKIEKTTNMKQAQFLIIKILSRLFNTTKTYEKGGLFIHEGDMHTSQTQFRKPDLSIYYAEQELGLINGENQIAPWVGEVISPSDNINRVNKKVHEYFAAGVKVVWNIFPELDEVYVYTAPDDVTICQGKRICSAKPALEDFEISAADIFAYKKLLKSKT